MDETPSHPERDRSNPKFDEGDQLRTIAFRMREIQRLLAMRVEQENRRLTADNLEPVTDTQFRHFPADN